MRLIDADDLIAHTFKNDISYKAFVNLVKKQPTIEERKTGKWHQRFYPQIEMMVCSECNSEFSHDAETGVRDYNYCPHCGARMREVKDVQNKTS